MQQQIKRVTELSRALKKAWCYLCEVSGDAAYENYLKYCAAHEANSNATPRMTRAEFYADAQHRKYSTINRCC
jgi:uncharacterized short protein YbdD (DUF466 family)